MDRDMRTLCGMVVVAVLFTHLAHRPAPKTPEPRAVQPTDPVTGVKMDWLTYLYRHSEAFRERHR